MVARALVAARGWTGVGCPGELRARLNLCSRGAEDVRALRRRSSRKTNRGTVGRSRPLAGYLTAARGQLLRCDQSARVGLCRCKVMHKLQNVLFWRGLGRR